MFFQSFKRFFSLLSNTLQELVMSASEANGLPEEVTDLLVAHSPDAPLEWFWDWSFPSFITSTGFSFVHGVPFYKGEEVPQITWWEAFKAGHLDPDNILFESKSATKVIHLELGAKHSESFWEDYDISVVSIMNTLQEGFGLSPFTFKDLPKFWQKFLRSHDAILALADPNVYTTLRKFPLEKVLEGVRDPLLLDITNFRLYLDYCVLVHSVDYEMPAPYSRGFVQFLSIADQECWALQSILDFTSRSMEVACQRYGYTHEALERAWYPKTSQALGKAWEELAESERKHLGWSEGEEPTPLPEPPQWVFPSIGGVTLKWATDTQELLQLQKKFMNCLKSHITNCVKGRVVVGELVGAEEGVCFGVEFCHSRDAWKVSESMFTDLENQTSTDPLLVEWRKEFCKLNSVIDFND